MESGAAGEELFGGGVITPALETWGLSEYGDPLPPAVVLSPDLFAAPPSPPVKSPFCMFGYSTELENSTLSKPPSSWGWGTTASKTTSYGSQ